MSLGQAADVTQQIREEKNNKKYKIIFLIIIEELDMSRDKAAENQEKILRNDTWQERGLLL